MAPSNLQGLNLIHPETPPSNLTDAQDLLSAPLFADFANNDLDLWSNINFASDEPFVSAKDRQLKTGETETRAVADHKEGDASASTSAGPQFDFARFLAEVGFGANPEAGNLSGLALPQTNFVAPPAVGVVPSATSVSAPAPTLAARSSTSTPAPETAPPAAKRARTAKTPAPAVAIPPSPTSADSPLPDLSTPLTASEDKRRRNTAASARFRLKKKEREAALDARAQALEDRVTSLERECEGLRRENGWLRGLVVGVTGGVVPAMNDAPIIAPSGATGSIPSSTSAPMPATAETTEKRKRGDEGT